MKKTNLEDFKIRAIRHGELVLKPILELPQGAEKVFEGQEHICSHSETGHHHIAVADTPNALRVFQLGTDFFLEAVKDLRLEHRKEFEKHETKTIFKGLYQITIKQSYDYFAKRMESVRD
jgi:hypothetical protein